MQLDVEMSPSAKVRNPNLTESSFPLGERKTMQYCDEVSNTCILAIFNEIGIFSRSSERQMGRQMESDVYEPIMHKHRWAQQISEV